MTHPKQCFACQRPSGLHTGQGAVQEDSATGTAVTAAPPAAPSSCGSGNLPWILSPGPWASRPLVWWRPSLRSPCPMPRPPHTCPVPPRTPDDQVLLSQPPLPAGASQAARPPHPQCPPYHRLISKAWLPTSGPPAPAPPSWPAPTSHCLQLLTPARPLLLVSLRRPPTRHRDFSLTGPKAQTRGWRPTRTGTGVQPSRSSS